MACPDEERFAVHIANLRSNLNYGILKTKLLRFFSDIGIQVARSDIDLHTARQSKNVYGYIYLADEYEYQYILDFFKAEGTRHLPALDEIAAKGKVVRVTRKGTSASHIQAARSRSRSQRRKKSRHRNVTSSGGSTETEEEECQNNSATHDDLRVTVKLPDYGEGRKLRHGMDHTVYIHGQTIGTESRVLEFKQGRGNYIKDVLKDHVGKYMVSFLNNQGGTLLVGVNDAGRVEGVRLNQKEEDHARLLIDEAIKGVRPEIFPQMYTVHFVPVTQGDSDNLKVIEIQIKEGHNLQLYEDGYGDVYIRRDGSVQGPLRASQIQEWTRMTMGREHHEMDTEIKALKDKERELSELIKQKEKSERELQEKISRLRKTESQVCAIL